MSGEWSRACDERRIVLSEPDSLAAYAAWHLGFAIWMSGDDRRAAVEKAGACIRAWRKSMPEQGERMWDFSSQPSDTDLLWIALRCVGYAQGVPNSISLRSAEAALRTWWRRQVRP